MSDKDRLHPWSEGCHIIPKLCPKNSDADAIIRDWISGYSISTIAHSLRTSGPSIAMILRLGLYVDLPKGGGGKGHIGRKHQKMFRLRAADMRETFHATLDRLRAEPSAAKRGEIIGREIAMCDHYSDVVFEWEYERNKEKAK
jgi:hypothetical protein